MRLKDMDEKRKKQLLSKILCGNSCFSCGHFIDYTGNCRLSFVYKFPEFQDFSDGKWQFDKAMEAAGWDEEVFDWMIGETLKNLDAAEKNEFWKQYNTWKRECGS